MSNLFEPIQTADLNWYQGLPFSIKYDDVYHSFASGIEQSRHVFIEGNDLIHRWQLLDAQALFTIAETGFGTGLNFILSWFLWEQHAPKTSRLHFISCEKYPFTLDDLTQSLKSWPELEKQAQMLIAHYPILTPGYHHLSFCEGRVTLTLMLGEALTCYEQLLICGDALLEKKLRAAFIDAWFLDGFSPKKNKSMWSDKLIQIMALLSKSDTTLATYTAAAEVKNSLKHNGFLLEKRKGFGPKRHMITGCRDNTLSHNMIHRHTPWHVGIVDRCMQLPQKKTAVVVGAGLAGCFVAYSLAKKGWKVTLIDELNEVGQAASANQQAVLFPKLSAYNSPLTQFLLSSFLYSARVYQDILKHNPIGELHGALLLASNQKEQLAQAQLANWLTHYPELGVLVDENEASLLAGLPLQHPGLFIPLSGWINSPKLCQFLVNTEGISLITNTAVKELFFDKYWHVNEWQAEVVVLANGNKITSFNQTKSLPIKSIRGQMTSIHATKESRALKIPLCDEGHVLPAVNGIHLLGATYELKTADFMIKAEDDLLNIAKLRKLGPYTSWSNEIVHHWAGVRAATPDYLPVVGAVASESDFLNLYTGLRSNSKRWINEEAPYYPGLYAFAGFGSRGLTTIPLSAEWLASLINNQMSLLPRTIIQAISPARFLRKNITRGHIKIS